MMKYCDNCGKKIINNSNFCTGCGKNINNGNINNNNVNNNKNGNKNNSVLASLIVTLIIIGVLVFFGYKILSPWINRNKDYAEKSEYHALDIQQLHADYDNNEIEAKKKYSGNYYYFSGDINDITSFLTDDYLEFKYRYINDERQIIQLNAYFDDSKTLERYNKGQNVTVYCKFSDRSIEKYAGVITSYSFNSCQFFD